MQIYLIILKFCSPYLSNLFINFHLDEFQLFDFVQYKNIIKKGEAETELNLKEINNLLLPNKTS